MSDRIQYLATLDVEALHAFIMEQFGVPPSHLRDRGLLESAVMRAQTAAHYARADLIEQAALLAVGISQAQAFVDGNKRTAFLAADTFLGLNGYTFSGDPLEMGRMLSEVTVRRGSMEDAESAFSEWLRENVTPSE